MSTDAETLAKALDQLNNELADIDERRAAIKGSIEKAQADRRITGEYADADWFRRAKGALRHLGVERSEVCRQIGDINRMIRAANANASRDLFRTAVAEVVDPLTWDRIIARVQEMRVDER